LILVSVAWMPVPFASGADQTVLMLVAVAALFAARGDHARPVGVRGFVAAGVLVGVAGSVLIGGLGVRHVLGEVMFLVGGFNEATLFYAVVLPVAVVFLLAYRSAVWPVALAVVGLVGMGPALLAELMAPSDVGMMNLSPLLSRLVFLLGGLVAIAALAVVKERRAARGERPAPVS